MLRQVNGQEDNEEEEERATPQRYSGGNGSARSYRGKKKRIARGKSNSQIRRYVMTGEGAVGWRSVLCNKDGSSGGRRPTQPVGSSDISCCRRNRISFALYLKVRNPNVRSLKSPDLGTNGGWRSRIRCARFGLMLFSSNSSKLLACFQSSRNLKFQACRIGTCCAVRPCVVLCWVVLCCATLHFA